MLYLILVDLPGFEPRLLEPKSNVLPLHHRSIHTHQERRKGSNFFLIAVQWLLEYATLLGVRLGVRTLHLRDEYQREAA